MNLEFDHLRAAWQGFGVSGGGGAEHVTVLGAEVAQGLAPALVGSSGGVLVDATAGLGGHTLGLLTVARPGRAVLFDRDAEALAVARERLADVPCPVDFVHAPFSELTAELGRLGIDEVAAIVADLGVSSLQLDRVERGFSFRGDAPLDMRMDRSRGRTAAEVLAEIDAKTLAQLLRDLGEEPDARRIADAIVAARPTTTGALAQTVADAMSARQRRKLGTRINPATRTFQALRIHVNGELDELDRFLADAPSVLGVGGRLAVITFHSLEDRRVKTRFRDLTTPPALPPHLPVTEAERPRASFSFIPEIPRSGRSPSEAEVAANPRARSARLRGIQRDLP